MDKPCFWHHFSITHRVYFVLQFRKKKERKKENHMAIYQTAYSQ